jgi:hypothetical protein
VANKGVKGKQLTVVWHVDDLKVSHLLKDVVSNFVAWLKEVYEQVFEDGTGAMRLSRGKVHLYLGMNLDYSVVGEVKITMIPYVQELVTSFKVHDSSDKTAITPASDNLFQVNPDAVPLQEEKASIFHNFVARSLYLTKRARPDIATAVAFLTTRVKGPDVDNWNKLLRLIRYLRGTLELPLTIRPSDMSVLRWYVDGSHASHPDCRGQTGGCLTLGNGAPITTSIKQKLNTRSSTESELVAADDVTPTILWVKLFLEAQGCAIGKTILYQDNQSAILLEKNGQKSSSKRTKHLNCRYFFITDQIKKGYMSVEYCPTTEMIADFFTKPLQGKLFVKFRKAIMNLSDE